MDFLISGFGGMGAVSFLIFVLAFGFILFVICKSIMQWNKNNHSPRLTVDATVVTKRTQVTTHHHDTAGGGGHVMHDTAYFVAFQVESGDRMEFRVNGREYGMLAEGDAGKLTFQGTRYLEFERGIGI